MIEEYAKWKKFYPDLYEKVYAPKWYYAENVKHDTYSYNLYKPSKEKDLSKYFFPFLKEVIDNLQTQGRLTALDIITIIPSHQTGRFSPTTDALAQKLSDYINLPYEKIISRIKDTRQNTLRLPNALDRFNSVKDSMKIARELTEDGILLLDDVRTTGITILEAKKILLEAGVKRTVTVCLGINSSKDRNGQMEGKK